VSFDDKQLFELLPAVYRLRDVDLATSTADLLTPAEASELQTLNTTPSLTPDQVARRDELNAKRERGPLRSLLIVLAREIGVLEENLEQLYDDQFIETCAEWAAPYIGDLIGYRSVHGVAAKVASRRAEVANTVAYRRRKGTAVILEQLARDVTDWPARAVEFFERLATSQFMNHIRPYAPATVDLRAHERLAFRDTAFDSLAHTVDVRRIATGTGRYNIRNIGLFLWRVRAFPLTRSPIVPDPSDGSGRRFRLNPLGADLQLFSIPQTETEITHLAEQINVPLPLQRRFMADHLSNYYGPGLSVELAKVASVPTDPPTSIPVEAVHICNLSDEFDSGGGFVGWAHETKPGPDEIAIDPVLGRVVFGTAPTRPVLASFHYGFTLAIGGGEYERASTLDEVEPVQRVGGGVALQPALDAVAGGGVVEITDSGRYHETPVLHVNTGQHLVLRAANGVRPVLAASGNIELDIAADGTITLDGLLISGGALTLDGFADDEPRHIVLRHCTFVPGQTLNPDGTAVDDNAPSLIVAHPFAHVEIDRCILGRVQAIEGAEVTVRESIVDARAESGVAYCGLTHPSPGTPLGVSDYLAGLADIQNETAAGGDLTTEDCTIIGKTHTNVLQHASNTLFVAQLSATDLWAAPLWAERRQLGCVRFSYVPPHAITPRRFHCVPADDGDARLRPYFTSRRYGEPGYCQLQAATSDLLRRGADDEGEIGVMHGLHQPQRETNLRVRLEEYLRYGLEANFFYAT